jgi:hypothetical protein
MFTLSTLSLIHHNFIPFSYKEIICLSLSLSPLFQMFTLANPYPSSIKYLSLIHPILSCKLPLFPLIFPKKQKGELLTLTQEETRWRMKVLIIVYCLRSVSCFRHVKDPMYLTIGLHGSWCVITGSEYPHHVALLAQKCDNGAMSRGYQKLACERCVSQK